jgi:hypothetical protein
MVNIGIPFRIPNLGKRCIPLEYDGIRGEHVEYTYLYSKLSVYSSGIPVFHSTFVVFTI